MDAVQTVNSVETKQVKNFAFSLVIPVYNEEESIAELIQEVAQYFSDFSQFECIVVDDASKDNTLSVLKSLLPTYSFLKVYAHQQNRGQSAAVVTGVKQASFPWVATIDGDGQNPPSAINELISAAQVANSDNILVMGHRTQRQDNLLRKISSRVANNVRRSILHDNTNDSGCGLKLFPKSIFMGLPHFKNCHRFIPALFIRAGATIIEVPVAHRNRMQGTSKYGVMNRLWTGIIDLLGVAWLIRRPIQTGVKEISS